MTDERTEVAERVAEILVGQCMLDIEDALTQIGHEELRDDAEFLASLDERVFRCGGCDWWCSTDEQNDDNQCDDCTEGDENA